MEFPPLAVARRAAQQPADPADVVRRPRARARPRPARCSSANRLADADRARRHGQDAAVAAGRRERGRRLPGRRLLRRRSRRSASRRSCRRASRPRSASPNRRSRTARPRSCRGLARRQAGPARARQLRAGARRGPARRRPAPRVARPEGARRPSRAPLHVSGEQEYPVPGLPTPPDLSQLTALERAEPAGASCARSTPRRSPRTRPSGCSSPARPRSSPGFAVTNDNAPAVAAICARLHGMPLAIELAAARIKLLSPDAILARLEHQLDLLAGRRARPAGAAADAARRDRLELRPPRRAEPAAARPAVGLRRRHRPRGGRGGLRARRRSSAATSSTACSALADQSLVRTIEDRTASRASRCSRRSASSPPRCWRRAASARRSGARHGAWFARRSRRRRAPELQRRRPARCGWTASSTSTTTSASALDRAAAREDAEVAIALGFAHAGGSGRSAATCTRPVAGWTPWPQPTGRDAIPCCGHGCMEALGGVALVAGRPAGMARRYGEALALWRDRRRRELANALYNYSFVFAARSDACGRRSTDADRGDGLRPRGGPASSSASSATTRRGQRAVGPRQLRYFCERPGSGEGQFRVALEKFRRSATGRWRRGRSTCSGARSTAHGGIDEAREITSSTPLRHFYDAGRHGRGHAVLDDLSAARGRRRRPAAGRAAAGRGAQPRGSRPGRSFAPWSRTRSTGRTRPSVRSQDVARRSSSDSGRGRGDGARRGHRLRPRGPARAHAVGFRRGEVGATPDASQPMRDARSPWTRRRRSARPRRSDPATLILTCANCGAATDERKCKLDLAVRLLPVLLTSTTDRRGPTGQHLGC